MKKWKKGFNLSFVLVLTTALLSACGDPDTTALEAQVAGLEAQNAQLQAQIAAGTITETTSQNSLRVIDGTSKAVFGTIDGMINFPNKLEIPNAGIDSNNSRVQIGSQFSFAGSGSWQFKFDGTQLNLQHPQKIWGQVKAVTIQTSDTLEAVQEMHKAFFKGFPTTNITYRNLFIGDTLSGLFAQAPINVDRKDYQVVTGIIESREVGLVVLFVYKDDGTGVQQELIDSFLNTGTNRTEQFRLD